jgi:subtilisin family serine protease
MSRRKSLIAGVLAAALAAAIAAPALATAPNDARFRRQWGLTEISAPQAWQVSRGEGVLIAIVDSGVDLNHPDLDDKIVLKRDADFIDPNGKNGPQDENGHGTHVAGIAAAETGNGVGVAGTAPAARILPVRVLDEDNNGTTNSIAKGIRFAAEHDADVINLSLAYLTGADRVEALSGDLTPVRKAIDFAWEQGAVIVAAAGNDSLPICAEPSAHARVVCVGATDRQDLRSWFSNSDATLSSTYLVAPGGTSLACTQDIFSTYLRSAGKQACAGDPGYHAISGTSMAAPFVSGTAALLVAQGLSNEEVVTCLKKSTDDLGPPGRDPIFGYGRLDAAQAVRC